LPTSAIIDIDIQALRILQDVIQELRIRTQVQEKMLRARNTCLLQGMPLRQATMEVLHQGQTLAAVKCIVMFDETSSTSTWQIMRTTKITVAMPTILWTMSVKNDTTSTTTLVNGVLKLTMTIVTVIALMIILQDKNVNDMKHEHRLHNLSWKTA
jgi:hypothetical protein